MQDHPQDSLAKTLARALKNAGLKRTKTREVLLHFLSSEHGPFSIEEINQQNRSEGLDLVTVYRCMAAFEKAGLVRRCDFGDGVARYEHQDDPQHHHHHVICRSCRKSASLAKKFESCKLPSFEKSIKSLGFSDITHSLEFFGVCKNCQKTGKKASDKLVHKKRSTV